MTNPKQEQLKQEKQIYLLTSNEDRDIVRDSIFSKAVAEIHRKNTLDSVFINSDENYPILENYCKNNETSPIEVVSIEKRYEDRVLNYFSDIINYSKSNPNKKALAHILEEDIKERLESLFKKADFQVVDVLFKFREFNETEKTSA